MLSTRSTVARTLMWAGIACAATGLTSTHAAAEALLLIEAESGKVLFAENATYPWYPASITKLMTAYVTLRAVKEGRITLDKPLTVSANAVAQQPVKMGFAAGTVVTVDNALKMLMVKSANDMAVVLAEGVGGSIESFADQMNANARRIGMTQSSFVNPNGLPADDQIVSARDMGILARALIRELPEYDYYWHLPGIRMGKMVQRNYNTLIGRYPGADGMKTGFICASGFNLVASATRDGKRLIAVVLGAPSSAARAMKAAQLLERGFNGSGALAWLAPSLGTVETLQPVNAAPPNLRDDMCGGHRKRQATEDEDDVAAANTSPDSPYAVFLSSLHPKTKGAALLQESNLGEPVLVYTGIKPPAPGAAQAGWGEPKPKAPKKKIAAKPPAGQDANPPADTDAKPPAAKDAKQPAVKNAKATAKDKDAKATAAKDKDGAAPNAAATPSDSAPAPKPKAKKPAAKPSPTTSSPTTTSATQQTSQTR
jgi:D-alanyl-D-alanine carboxypeptidase